MDQEDYTKEELQNIQALIDLIKRIDKELKEEGIPVDEYERILIHGEDPLVVFGNQEIPD
jgi:hypothetical protein